MLGPDALRELRLAVLAGRHTIWLREISAQALRDGRLEQAIAAAAIALAGKRGSTTQWS